MNYTSNSQIPSLFFSYELHLCTLYTYLSGYLFRHLGNMSILVSSSGYTESLANPFPYFIFFVCLRPPNSLLFVPTIHISHMSPPLTTRWLNTAIQVNNTGMLHLMYNRHIFTSHNYHYLILPSYFFYILGQAGWSRPFMSGTLKMGRILKLFD
jgi:hypothetical protein